MSRKKANITEPSAAPKHASDDVRPRRQKRERLPSSVLNELWSIWRADPRVPSIRSRRSWAISRNANHRLVGCWFLRRKACAKKAGQPVPDESYDLPLDPPIVPKREQSAIHIEHDFEALDDLPSDDTLVYPPDIDDLNDMEASSDTVCDEDALIETKRTETAAYKEVPPQPCLERQPEPSSVDVCAAEEPYDDKVSLTSSFLVCNQGRGNQSNFTCVLCSVDPTQDITDEVLLDTDVTFDSRENLSTSCPRLDSFPDTLSKLSAIPFLFRTPRTMYAENGVEHQNLNNWSVIEDELGRLVNDGELDFSFLDVPDLASMKLPD